MGDEMLDRVMKFAKHLDNNEFNEALIMLSKDCEYHFRDQSVVGPEAIIDCYRGSLDSVKDQLDTIEFVSKVTKVSEDKYELNFTDIISKNGNKHIHKCKQVVFIKGKLVERIEHVDLEGEVESLNSYFESMGIVRK